MQSHLPGRDAITRFLIPAAAAAIAIAAASQSPAPAQAASPAETARGATLFQQRCAMCHVRNGKGGKVGPDLTKIMGRKAGTTAYAYSAAMKSSKLVWNAATLDKYLAAPTKTLPGTKMVLAVSKPEDRAAIVSYLATAN